jgi:hypothetical protein
MIAEAKHPANPILAMATGQCLVQSINHPHARRACC